MPRDSSSPPSRLGLPLAPTVALLGGAAGLLVLHDLRSSLVVGLGLLGLSFAGLLALVRSRRPRRFGLRRLLLLAALLRLLMVPLAPTLSSDVWRYLWDGRVAAAGANPYLLAPDDAALQSLRDGLWLRLDHREVPTLYPPLALTLFSIAARFPASVWLWKIAVSAADLIACALLARLALRLGIADRRVAWYAWNPLVALEASGMGHLDAIGVAAVLLAVGYLAVRPRRVIGAACGAAAAALAKLGPLAAFPLWARTSRRPVLFLTVAAGLVGVALAPVAATTGGVPPGLTTYAVSWEFDGPLYEPLWRTLDAVSLDDRIKAGLGRLKEATGWHDFWNRFYPWVYPQLLAKLVLAAVVGGLVLRSWYEDDPTSGTGRLFGGLLLCSPTVYPWYLLWVLPFAALYGRREWLWLSGAILLTYLPQRYPIPLFPWIYLAVWVPFFGLWAIDRSWTTT